MCYFYHMSPEDDLDPVWRALANPMRRRVLDALREVGRLSTQEVAARFPDVSRFAVMQHLGVLVAADLVIVKREGRVRWNHLNPVPLRRIAERWLDRYDEAFAGDLLALKRRVESPAPPTAVSRRARGKPAKAPTP
jgi:DNA-binding transcriptional ArsR family regulator